MHERMPLRQGPRKAGDMPDLTDYDIGSCTMMMIDD